MNDAKREMTIEELEKEYAKITEERQKIEKVLKQKKQEEEDRRIAQLALDKEKRQKEVEEAYDHYIKVATAYIKDYNVTSVTSKWDGTLEISDKNPFSWWF